MRIGVVIPALNEAATIGGVVQDCKQALLCSDDMRVVVCDNGSTDGTAAAATAAGAEVVDEAQRGYGAACLRAIRHLGDWPEALVFIDGDGSSDAAEMERLLAPLRRDHADLVIGCRQAIEVRSMSLPQRVGNWWFCHLVRLRWGVRCRDLGPFRAVRRSALQRLNMTDRTWGWTLEMEIKAVLGGLRVARPAVVWRRRRAGHSKISGSLFGAARACGKISFTLLRYVLHKRKKPPQLPDQVIAFVKHPRPGEVKTRLACAVGERRAADIYRRMAEHVHRELFELQSAGLVNAVVNGTGAATRQFRTWLPGASQYWHQPDGDLGRRLQHAFERAFAQGAPRVAAVGTDCPQLTGEDISVALGRLDRADVVLIPDTSGGYALIALKRPQPGLFDSMPWSTAAVRQATRHRARQLGLRLEELPPTADVDSADDLQALPALVSIVIPVLNEQATLTANLPRLLQQVGDQQEQFEVLVIDGGSSDYSADVAQQHGVTVLAAPRGRGVQMNVGAASARGDWVWFLHADCAPHAEGLNHLVDAIRRRPFRDWGYFPAKINARGVPSRLIELGVNFRSRLLNLPFGDQGLFIRRDTLRFLGGFAEVAVLEDVDLVLRLRHIGRPIRASGKLLIDARRWKQHGYCRVTRRNWKILRSFLMHGADYERLAMFYDMNRRPTAATADSAEERVVT